MNKIRTSACVLALSLLASAASAGVFYAATYEYLDGAGNVVGTKQVTCDGSVFITGQVTNQAIETGREDCGGSNSAGDVDPEVLNGPR